MVWVLHETSSPPFRRPYCARVEVKRFPWRPSKARRASECAFLSLADRQAAAPPGFDLFCPRAALRRVRPLRPICFYMFLQFSTLFNTFLAGRGGPSPLAQCDSGVRAIAGRSIFLSSHVPVVVSESSLCGRGLFRPLYPLVNTCQRCSRILAAVFILTPCAATAYGRKNSLRRQPPNVARETGPSPQVLIGKGVGKTRLRAGFRAVRAMRLSNQRRGDTSGTAVSAFRRPASQMLLA